ncbi:propionyl-CoA carboxylase alpha chain-like [Planoprotostelium fungivorum]|uniref:Propionyl-CoA carboxylase alpha chain, mitochondrial n=1 Tax=Planoprotostelium fungivorum TaxID=1890364 RepID=A0A2P6NY12_9EUKA|nr:propionyl-CoA carboxylase alpha chain-like [Planoprotostelium fungivorum]
MSTKLIGLGLPTRRMAPSIVPRRYYATEQPKYFNKILIANRGEIACRVIRTAKKLGIKTVAIHSEPDINSLHVRMADEAYCVGPAASNASYLNMDKIMQVIKESGAEAVHPGYGFLSENAKFAKLLEENKVAFIGPNSFAMSAMGDKIESKKLAQKAGVNVIPGRLVDISGVPEMLQIAREIGYPIMIKASAGGGGKGMRIAWDDKEAEEGYRLAKQEAASSFGDDRLLVEKYIDNPRHIEIQIMADGQGTTLYFNERECSIQRRNQKVLEEAPSPFIDEETRKAMGKQACQLAEAVGYKSAGTVEFLVDSQRNFYFLEMNTRLQVEHPITEYITGVDLVELMIKVAAGNKLEMTQSQVGLKGWAMEARVYAEDPLRNFLPSIGRLNGYREPTETFKDGNTRVDSGVVEGDDIQIHYDPLISKLVTYGTDRREAIKRMSAALDSYVIRGVNHNVPFLRSVMEHPRYIQGNLSTKFIAEEFPEGFKGHQLTESQSDELVVTASLLHYNKQLRNYSQGGIHSVPKDATNFVVTVEGKQHKITLEDVQKSGHKLSATVHIDGSRHYKSSTETPLSQQVMQVDLETTDKIVQNSVIVSQFISAIPHGYRLQHYGSIYDVHVESNRETELRSWMPKKKVVDTTKFLASPMPGRVLSVNVKVGDEVTAGQEIAVVEAMKMQNVLRASRDAKVSVQANQDVQLDQVLVEFE